jgi:hypothetical protein
MRVNKLGAFVTAMTLAALTPARAGAQTQTPATLEQAREIFGQALKDENAGHYDTALDKYRMVLTVKDTPSVRFRIASCLKAQKKLVEARDAFAGIQGPAGNAVAQSAAVELKQLDARIPDLTVTLTGPGASQGAITIDGQPSTAGRAVQVNPGDHVVVVAGAGVKKMQSTVTVAESTHKALSLQVDVDAPQKAEQSSPPPPAPEAPPPADHSKTYGFIGLGVGGALLGGSLVLTILENGQVSKIESACPGGNCPISKHSDTESMKSTASTEYTAAIVLLATGVVATGVGAYFLFKPTKKTQLAIAPTPTGAAMSIGGSF